MHNYQDMRVYNITECDKQNHKTLWFTHKDEELTIITSKTLDAVAHGIEVGDIINIEFGRHTWVARKA